MANVLKTKGTKADVNDMTNNVVAANQAATVTTTTDPDMATWLDSIITKVAIGAVSHADLPALQSAAEKMAEIGRFDVAYQVGQAINALLAEQAVAKQSSTSKAYFVTFESDSQTMYISLPAMLSLTKNSDGKWTSPRVSMQGAFRRNVSNLSLNEKQRQALKAFYESCFEGPLTNTLANKLAATADNTYSASEVAAAKADKKKADKTTLADNKAPDKAPVSDLLAD